MSVLREEIDFRGLSCRKVLSIVFSCAILDGIGASLSRPRHGRRDPRLLDDQMARFHQHRITDIYQHGKMLITRWPSPLLVTAILPGYSPEEVRSSKR